MMTLEDAGPLTLDASLQGLIDARLDTIDRMLVGRVPRADRLAIAREVEAQIFDQLAGQSPGGIGRDEVLAVLGRLDPPEAYLPEDGEAGPVVSGTTGMRVPTRPVQAHRSGKASGIVGLLGLMGALFGMILCVVITKLIEIDSSLAPLFIIWCGIGSVGLATGVIAVVLAARVKLGDGWAVLGLVTGILAIIVGTLPPAGLSFVLLLGG